MNRDRARLEARLARYEQLFDRLVANDALMMDLIRDMRGVITQLHGPIRIAFDQRLPSLDLRCVCCNSMGHAILECEFFRDMAIDGRYRLMRRNNLCGRCLAGGHALDNCPHPQNCIECGDPHHRMLCPEFVQRVQAERLARLFENPGRDGHFQVQQAGPILGPIYDGPVQGGPLLNPVDIQDMREREGRRAANRVRQRARVARAFQDAHNAPRDQPFRDVAPLVEEVAALALGPVDAAPNPVPVVQMPGSDLEDVRPRSN